jgi:hypothetical protein
MAREAKAELVLCGEDVDKGVDKRGYLCGRVCIKCG